MCQITKNKWHIQTKTTIRYVNVGMSWPELIADSSRPDANQTHQPHKQYFPHTGFEAPCHQVVIKQTHIKCNQYN